MISFRRLLLREQVIPVTTALVLGAGFVWVELARQARVQAEAMVAADLGHLGREVTGNLQAIEDLGRVTAELWASGVVDPREGDRCWQALAPLARPLGNRLAGLNLVRPDGRSFGLAPRGTHLHGWTTDLRGGAWVYDWVSPGETHRGETALDFRTRPWFHQAQGSREPRWVEPFRFFGEREGQPGIAWVVPWRDAEGRLQGIVAVHVLLEEVTDRLRRIRPTPGAVAMAVDLQGRVVAAPSPLEGAFGPEPRAQFLQPVGPNRYPWAEALLNAHRQGRYGSQAGWGRFHRYQAQGLQVERPGLAWFLALALPEADLATDPRRRALVAGGVALMLAALFWWQAYRLARKVAVPLGALGEAAEALGRAEAPDVPASPIREVQSVAQALEAAHHARLERETLQDQLRQAQKLETIGTLAGGIAHDVNNQLTAILGQLELTRERLAEGEPARRNLDRASAAAQRCAETTRALLAFSRPSPPQLSPLDLNGAVEEALVLLRRVVSAPVVLATELTPGLPPVEGDRVQLEQVLVNLVVNARDAMPAGGAIRVCTEAPVAGEVHLVVQDNGVGMTPEVQARIFEPFFTTKPVGQGTGLGLAMVLGIVKAHGGTVEVESRWGEGTRFRIRLRAAQVSGAAAPQAGPTERIRMDGVMILLAEDEAVIRATLAEALTARGALVVEAADGEEAWERFRGQHFDALVSDHLMPRCTGLDLLQRIRAVAPEFPVILASGRGLEGLEERLDRDRRLRVLSKPFSMARLLENLLDLLREGASVRPG